MAFMVQWIVLGMPGITLLGNPPARFLTKAYEVVNSLFSADYLF